MLARNQVEFKILADFSQQPLLLSVTMRDKPDFPVVPGATEIPGLGPTHHSSAEAGLAPARPLLYSQPQML